MPMLRPGLLQVPLTFWNNAFTLLSAVGLPRQECSTSSFYVKHVGECPGPAGCLLSRTPADACLPCRALTHVESRSSEGETL